MKWRDCLLGDVITLQRGYDLPESQRQPGDVPVITSSGITGRHHEAKAKAPGVVTGRYGTLGEVLYIEDDDWPHNTALYVKDFKGNCPRFVAYFLRNTLKNYQSDKAAVPGIDRNVLHALIVRMPNLPTQEAIVGLLSAYDDLIENNRRRMALLEESARLLYQEWFVRLRFPGHEHTKIVNSVPEGWMKRKLSDCSTFLSGGTPSKSKPEYWDGDIPWISSGEMTPWRLHQSDRMVTDEGAANGSRMIPRNTILAVVRGMSLAKEFRVAICSKAMTFNQDLKAIVAGSVITPIYLYSALLSQRDHIRDRATEASHGTKKLDTSVLCDIDIVVPTHQIQEMFGDFINPIHDLWDRCWNQNVKLKEARDLLLPRLMSGEVAV